LGAQYLFATDDTRRLAHGFLFSEVLSVDVSILLIFILKTLPGITVVTYGFVVKPKSQPALKNFA
jgi:hypothetical protein